MDYKFDENYEVSEDSLGTKIKHPSFGTVAFSRRSGGRADTLFGSSIRHRDTITLAVRHASLTRGINNDWYSGHKDIVEVEMSYNQFVEAITNMNNGTGIPCTIRYTEKEGYIPHPHFIDKYTEFADEFKSDQEKRNEEAEQLVKEVREMFETKSSINKKDRAEILEKLERIVLSSKHNNQYLLEQFQEQMDKTVQEAKGEIEAFTQNKMLIIAQQALVEQQDKLLEMEVPVVSLGLPKNGEEEE